MQVHESSAVFVGRHPHLSLLAADARRTEQEGARAVLVCGGAGVGKSRLLAEHLRRVPGTPAAVGGCLELGAEGIPFAPFTALLRELVRSGGPAADPTGDLGRLLPELGGAAGTADAGRARLFESVLTYLEGRARPDGLTLVIEDLHWADASTRDLLVFLLRNLGPAPIHLLISVRTDDLHRSHPLRRLLPELERLPRVRRLDLEPLSRDEVGAQATALRGGELDPADLDLLYERSGGNPLFVESFLAAGHDPAGAPIPDGPRDLLLAAVEPLPEPTRRVLGLVATAGIRVRHTLLANVARRAGITEDALDSALRPAIDAQILRSTEDGYVFRHALLAEAVHSELMPGERVRAHRRYAEALQDGVDRMPESERALQLAHHAHRAHDQPLALTAAWQAAEHAAAVDAYPEHLALIERVLELWDQVPDAAERTGMPRDQVLVRASGTSLVAGSLRRAVSYATDGLDELGVTGLHDPDNPPEHAVRISRLRHARARALKEMGRDGALEDLAEASVLLTFNHPEAPAVGATLAATFMMRGHHEQAAVVARRILNRARQLGDRRSEADALITLGALSDPADTEEGLKLFGEGIGLAREIGHVPAEIRGMTNLSGYLKNLNRLEESAQVSLEGLRRCRELGLIRTQGGAFAYGLAVTRFNQGRFAESEELLSGIRDGGVTSARALTLRMHLDLYRWRPDAVRATVDEFRRVLPERVSSPVEHLPVHMVLQQLAVYEGRPMDAGRMARDLLARAIGDGVLATMVHGLYRATLTWYSSIAARLAEEPGEEARLLAEEIRQLLTDLPSTSDHSDAAPARLAAEAWLSADPKEALALFEAALAGLVPTGHVISQAEYGLAAAHAALRAEERESATEHVNVVHRLAVRHGLALFERETRVLRARHGLPGPGEHPAAHAAPERAALTSGITQSARPVPSSPAAEVLPMGLTRRELEVLTEVAKGLSNREVGQVLFISAKTVSVHVTNLMGKLGVNNRTAAAAKGRELGLF